MEPRAETAAETAALLNEACRRVVATARGGDARATAELARRLTAQVRDAQQADDPRRFLAALARLLQGQPLEVIEGDLPPSWRSPLRAVARDIEHGPGEPGPDPDRDTDQVRDQDQDQAAWAGELATHTATVLRERDRAGAVALDAALARLIGAPGHLDPAAARFVHVLRGALAGRDMRAAVLALDGPYAVAYRALEASVRAEGSNAGGAA